MDQKLYMPILKWKAGEQEALANLDNEIKKSMIPLIEIMDLPSTRKKAPSVEEYLSEVVSDILDCWGSNPILIDLYDLEDSLNTGDGKHFLHYLFSKLVDEKITAIPVLSFQRSEAYLNTVIDINSIYKTGICVRISTDYLDDVSGLLDSLKKKNNIMDKDLSVILDFGYFNSSQVSAFALVADAATKTISNIDKLNLFAVSGTGFPESISGIESRSIGEIDRSEWLLWKKLKNKGTSLRRLPIYGDYNVTHPELIDFDPVTMKIGGKIKYTTEDKFIIFKGSSLKKDGSEQMYSIAKSVTAHPAYMGEAFSWGDERIAKCARIECSPGNPKTWVTVAINHHLAFVVYQLSN